MQLLYLLHNCYETETTSQPISYMTARKIFMIIILLSCISSLIHQSYICYTIIMQLLYLLHIHYAALVFVIQSVCSCYICYTVGIQLLHLMQSLCSCYICFTILMQMLYLLHNCYGVVIHFTQLLCTCYICVAQFFLLLYLLHNCCGIKILPTNPSPV